MFVRGEPIKNGGEIIGNRTKVKIVKNKAAPPFKNVGSTLYSAKAYQRWLNKLTWLQN